MHDFCEDYLEKVESSNKPLMFLWDFHVKSTKSILPRVHDLILSLDSHDTAVSQLFHVKVNFCFWRE